MKRIVHAGIVGLLCLLVATKSANAQAAPPAGAPPAPPAEEKRVTAMLTAGVSLETGSTEMYTTNVMFNLGFRRSPKTNVSFDVMHMHMSTKIPALERRTVITNMQIGHFKFEHDARKNVVIIAQTTGTHDEVRHIRHRLEQFAGVGWSAGDRRVTQFRVVPLAAVTVQDKNLELEDNFQQGVGLMQDLTAKLNDVWSFNESVLYRAYLSQDDDYALNASAALNGRVTKRVGVQLAFIHSHENLVVPGTIKRYQKIQGSVTYTF